MKHLHVAVALLLLGVLPVLAQEQEQVTVTADSFVVEQASSQAVFSGNVKVVRTGLTVWADKVVVEYAEGGMDQIRSFVATGSVRLRTDDQEATGERAVFDPETQVLRLLGNVVVTNELGTVKGPELVVNLADSTSAFTGGKGSRVTGVFTPQ